MKRGRAAAMVVANVIIRRMLGFTFEELHRPPAVMRPRKDPSPRSAIRISES